VSLSLKKLLRRRPLRDAVEALRGGFPGGFAIVDQGGDVLLGAVPDEAVTHHIAPAGAPLGAVHAPGPAAAAVAATIEALWTQETEKRQLGRETLERYRQITMLFDVGERISACFEVESIGQVVLEEARRHLGADSGALLLHESRSRSLEVVARFGPEFGEETAWSATEGIQGRVFQAGRAELVVDVSEEEAYTPAAAPITSLLCAPLPLGQEILGVLRLSTAERREWTAAEVKLVTSLASQAAAALRNALEHEQRRRAEALWGDLGGGGLADRIAEVAAVGAGGPGGQLALLFADIQSLRDAVGVLPSAALSTALDGYRAAFLHAVVVAGGDVHRASGTGLLGLFAGTQAAHHALAAATALQDRLELLATPIHLGVGVTAFSAEDLDETVPRALRRVAALQREALGGVVLLDAFSHAAAGAPPHHAPAGHDRWSLPRDGVPPTP